MIIYSLPSLYRLIDSFLCIAFVFPQIAQSIYFFFFTPHIGKSYFLEQFKMRLFLFFSLAIVTISIVVPVQTGQQRCMAIYSINQQDTIKISIKFPEDHSIQQFYDYIAEIRDLRGNILINDKVKDYYFKTEIIVPNQTIYEACIRILPNFTKINSTTQKYHGELLIQYEANTHFIYDQYKIPVLNCALNEKEIIDLQKQANHVINATKEYMKLQKIKKQFEVSEFQDKRIVEDTLFDWWMVQLIVIIGLGSYQWLKMKRKLENGNI